MSHPPSVDVLCSVGLQNQSDVNDFVSEMIMSFSFIDFTYKYPANIYLFKFNNRNTRTRCEIC